MINGADIGWISQLESMGYEYVDNDGNKKDPLELLKEFGINAIRLRLFVDPPGDFFWEKKKGKRVMLGLSDKAHVLKDAKRAHDAGMKLMIDFHLSDHFADPEYQDVPKLWEAADDVWAWGLIQEHVERFLEALKAEGITPEFVQIGNEINNGMLWPIGKYPEEKRNLAKFLSAGYEAVKSICPETKVITHLAEGNDKKQFEQFFDDMLIHYGAKTDVIGMSYYPFWLGKDYTKNIKDLTMNMMKCASKYKKDVMICEIGGLEDAIKNTEEMIKVVKKSLEMVPENRGLGIFYWEPGACAKILPDHYPLCACRLIDDKKLQFTDVMNAFKE